MPTFSPRAQLTAKLWAPGEHHPPEKFSDFPQRRCGIAGQVGNE